MNNKSNSKAINNKENNHPFIWDKEIKFRTTADIKKEMMEEEIKCLGRYTSEQMQELHGYNLEFVKQLISSGYSYSTILKICKSSKECSCEHLLGILRTLKE